MKCYVGYLIDDEREDGVPVSADVDKDQAEGQAIKRVLGSGIIAGSIQVLERDLSEEGPFLK